MNANEVADELAQLIQPPSLIDDAWAKDIISNAYAMLRILDGQLAFRIDAVTKYQAKVEEQQAEILAGKIMLKGYGKAIDEQQAEIEALKAENKALYNLVAEQDKKIIDLAFDKVYAERSAEVVAELYTHPVKELTDEEIAEVYEKCEWASGYVYWKEFARAILRKAQEK